jgi:hypothetical protein
MLAYPSQCVDTEFDDRAGIQNYVRFLAHTHSWTFPGIDDVIRY